MPTSTFGIRRKVSCKVKFTVRMLLTVRNRNRLPAHMLPMATALVHRTTTTTTTTTTVRGNYVVSSVERIIGFKIAPKRRKRAKMGLENL